MKLVTGAMEKERRNNVTHNLLNLKRCFVKYGSEFEVVVTRPRGDKNKNASHCCVGLFNTPSELNKKETPLHKEGRKKRRKCCPFTNACIHSSTTPKQKKRTSTCSQKDLTPAASRSSNTQL